jgi:phage terminase large subunit-like protein
LRQYRESIFLVGCKNAKSTLAVALVLFMLTSGNEGGAECYTTATKYAQARLIFDEVLAMVKQSPELSKHFRKRKNDLLYEPSFSKMQPLARNSDTLDGLNAHLVLLDEIHGVKDRNLYEVLKQSQTARRQPMLLMLTTAGTTRENVFDDLYSYTAQVADGAIPWRAYSPCPLSHRASRGRGNHGRKIFTRAL